MHDTTHRELLAVREIAHALLVADRPEDVQQFALERVTPLLGAAFSLVMRLSDDGSLLRPVAQHQWPERHRMWIGALRVRPGNGPSGVAVEEQRVVEIADLFADADLADWYDVARELGFRSILAAPLVGGRGVIGAVAFYFASETRVTEDQRALVRVVADQLAATAEKASLIDELRRSNAALADANAQLERLANDAEAARITRDRFTMRIAAHIGELLDNGDAGANDVRRAARVAEMTHELVQAERGTLALGATDIDPRGPLLSAVRNVRQRRPDATLAVHEPTTMVPTIRADARWLERQLEVLAEYALREVPDLQVVTAELTHGRGFVAYRVSWTADDEQNGDPERFLAEVDLQLVRQMAQLAGGELQLTGADWGRASSGGAPTVVLTLIFPVDITP